MARPIRFAAAGDVHCDETNREALELAFQRVDGDVDAILLAGDLTTYGKLEQGELLAQVCHGVQAPVFAVLGNHDWHCSQADEIVAALGEAGVRMVDRGWASQDVDGTSIGIAGVNWQVQIMALKFLDASGGGRDSDIAQGIYWAVQQGADLIVRLNPFSVVLGDATGAPLELCAALKHQRGVELVRTAVDPFPQALAAGGEGNGEVGTEVEEVVLDPRERAAQRGVELVEREHGAELRVELVDHPVRGNARIELRDPRPVAKARLAGVASARVDPRQAYRLVALAGAHECQP